jgi:arylsulfatase A-like enzyme
VRRAALCAALLLAACRAGNEPPVVLDLVSSAPAARFEGAAQLVLFGTPSGIASQLDGIYDAPASALADPSAWVAQSAEIGLRFAAAEERRAVLDMAPFPGLTIQSAEAFLNGKALGPIVLKPGRERYRLDLPAAAQRPGMNRLKLVFADTAAPIKAYRKRMAAVLYGIAVGRNADPSLAALLAPPSRPALSIENGALTQNLPGTVRYVFRAPAGGVVRVKPALARGSRGSASVRVTLNDEDGPAERVLWSGEAGGVGREVSVKLAVAEGALVSLGLHLEPGAAVTWGPARVVAARTGDPLRDPPGPVAADARANGLRDALKGANVLYVILDAAGARHFSSYGASRATTPEIDRIASEGVLFENAYTVASFTLLAMSSAWTSAYPTQHHNGVPYDAPLPKDRLTLAELLGANGIHTAGFVSNGVAGTGFGLDRGFAEFEEVYRRFGSHAGAFRNVLPSWFSSNTARRFFAYVHFREPHFAYDPPPPFNTMFGPDAPLTKTMKTKFDWITDVNWGRVQPSDAEVEHLRRLYDGNLAYVDREVGAIRRDLESAGLWDKTLVIVSADHGDQLYEHGYIGHLGQVYEQVLRIPLVVKFPKGVGPVGLRLGGFVDTLDIAPTIADAFGVLGHGGSDQAFHGRSLLPVVLGAPGKPAVFSRCADAQPKYALRSGPLKTIYHTARDEAELYDVVADPDERNDLAGTRPLETEYYVQTQRRWILAMRRGPTSVASDARLTGEQRENLKALGYVQ